MDGFYFNFTAFIGALISLWKYKNTQKIILDNIICLILKNVLPNIKFKAYVCVCVNNLK